MDELVRNLRILIVDDDEDDFLHHQLIYQEDPEKV